MTDEFAVPERLRHIETLVVATLLPLPPIEADPTAQLLGLVADPTRELDPNALRRARQARNVGPEALAARLRARGWSTRPLDIITWESRGAPSVVPAIIAAIAEELVVDPTSLTRVLQERPLSRLVTLKDRADVKALVGRLARFQHTTAAEAIAFLERSATSFAYRGTPDDDQYIKTLASFVDVLERRDGDDG